MKKEVKISLPKNYNASNIEHSVVNRQIILSYDLEEKFEPKDGDFVRLEYDPECIFIFNAHGGYRTSFYTGKTSYGEYHKENGCSMRGNASIELATEEQKQELLDLMHKNGDDWDAVNKKIIPYKYKPKDKELVWCWDSDDECRRVLKFYDAKNNAPFTYDGKRGGRNFDNYAPYESEMPDWAKEALTKLDD